MTVVVDANLLVSLIVPYPYSKGTSQKMDVWKGTGVEVIAPILYKYEALFALRKGVALGLILGEEALAGLEKLFALGIRTVYPTLELHRKALCWADRINQLVAYDAQYLAVAEQALAEFWTADRRLAESAKEAGATWVHWIGE